MSSLPIGTILKTKRLFLRYPKLDDAAQIFIAVKSPQFPEQLPLKEMRAENEIKDWLRRLQEGWKTGQVFSWIVEDRDARSVLGQMTLSKLEGIIYGQWDFGYIRATGQKGMQRKGQIDY